jgi:hypothetical protein
MGISGIQSKKDIGSYNICNYGDQTKAILTILSATDKKNFERNRKLIIKKAVGIPILDSPQKEIELLLIESMCLKNKWQNIDEEKTKKANQLAKELLNGNLSPYEITGKVKEATPLLKAKDMTELWTKLSIINGLEELKDEGLNKEWDQEIQAKSLDPKINNLQSTLSLSTEKEKKSIIQKSYYENYPHLKESKGKNTNWAEIITNMTPQTGGLLKYMLKSSKDNILKKETTEETLFPRSSIVEVENRRLSNLISTIGNARTNRLARYQRILFNLEEDRKVSRIPTPEGPKATDAEIRKVEKLIKKLEKIFSEMGIESSPEKIVDMMDKRTLYPTKTDILRLKKINTEKAQTAWDKWKIVIDYSERKLKDDDLVYLGEKGNPISQGTVIDKIKDLCKSSHNQNRIIQRFLNILEPTTKNIERLKSDITLKNASVRNFIERHITNKPPKEKWGRGLTLIESLQNNKEYPLGSKLGPAGVTPIQIAALLKDEEECTVLAEKLKNSKSDINPIYKTGQTPLFISSPNITKIFLKNGADLEYKDPKGKRAETENPYPESKKMIKEFRVKRKVQELAQKERESHDII